MERCNCVDYREDSCPTAKRNCRGHKREYNRKYHAENRESILERKHKYHYQNREKRVADGRVWNANRRARKLKATFGDAELNDLVFKEAHSLAKEREKLTGVAHEVDHIVPLKGANVCGFHSWNNIQVIPKHLNRSKGNRIMENL